MWPWQVSLDLCWNVSCWIPGCSRLIGNWNIRWSVAGDWMLDLPLLFADLHPSKDQHRIWEPTRLSFISWIIGTVKNFPSRNYLLLSHCKLIIAIIILIWDNFSKYTLSIKLGWSNMRNEIKLIKTSVTDCVFSITNNILRWNCIL